MKKRWIVLVLVAAAALLVFWLVRGDRSGPANGKQAAAARGGAIAPAKGPKTRALPDPRSEARASIAGTVRVKGGGPLAGATVCTKWFGVGLDSEATREPQCTQTDAAGRYRLADLVPASHRLSASAPQHQPRRWRDRTTGESQLRLTAGQQRTGVDFVLAPGGVELSGTVEDVSGGAIAGALVQLGGDWWANEGGGFARSDAQGRFTLWAKPGEIEVHATADGYAAGSADVVAPTQRALLLLTPESVLAGTVVLAGTRTPVPGALVSPGDWRDDDDGASARTDEAGRFRLTRLKPGRYKPIARGRGLYGQPGESVLLGLGQAVEDVVIEVHAAAAVRGKVVIASGEQRTPCTRGWINLTDGAAGRWEGDGIEPDGTVEIDAVLPGRYEVGVHCDGELPRDRYPAIEVATTDRDGLVWEVGGGGRIHGTVRTSSGAPVADAFVRVTTTGGAARAQRSHGGDHTDDAGRFELSGLAPGDYTIDVRADGETAPAPPPTVAVKDGATTEIEIKMIAGGAITGIVVDERGKPVSGASVQLANRGWWGDRARTGDDGGFKFDQVRPGEHRVVAQRGWDDAMRKPGSTDDDVQGERVTVAAGKTATVRLVVESRSGVITGTVTDSAGKPVGDAWVIAIRESDSAAAAQGEAARDSHDWEWSRDDRPVMTGTDGSFTVRELSPGAYTLRGFRKGGGEAIAEHVRVGGRASLVIRATGALAGTVVTTAGAVPDELQIAVVEEKTGFSRRERFFRTGGAWAIKDLPAGDFVVSADTSGARTMTKIALGAGEDKRGVRLVLEAKVRLRGRVVDIDTKAPVGSMKMSAQPVKGDEGVSFTWGEGGDREDISGDDGRFVIAQAPGGQIYVTSMPLDWQHGDYSWGSKYVVVPPGATEVDVGDFLAVKRRRQHDQPKGDLGLTFVRWNPEMEPEDFEMKIALVRRGGPAAREGIVVGDVVVSINGHDARGASSHTVWPLLDVAEGAKVTLGLKRGVSVTITAGPPL